jgi:hypothetical protein
VFIRNTVIYKPLPLPTPQIPFRVVKVPGRRPHVPGPVSTKKEQISKTNHSIFGDYNVIYVEMQPNSDVSIYLHLFAIAITFVALAHD